MTENNKPEWFEIAESDGPTAPRKASKTLPALAVFATALILGIGALVAQVQDKSPASAVDAASTQTEATNNPTSATSQSPMTDPSVGSSVSSTSGLKNPSIAQLPTKGDDDDEYGDDEDDEDEDDEDEEDEDDD
jgi:hypothetical protein